mmetsp:Transcript_3560/g.6920  ORF Transcript_3560/g.6920 Transcript_3560/m.6920 type:complete len:468 (+) Transcript_3560:70-1473(+)
MVGIMVHQPLPAQQSFPLDEWGLDSSRLVGHSSEARTCVPSEPQRLRTGRRKKQIRWKPKNAYLERQMEEESCPWGEEQEHPIAAGTCAGNSERKAWREFACHLPLQESAIEARPISRGQPLLRAVKSKRKERKAKPVSLQVTSGQIFSLQHESLMTECELKHILHDLGRRVPFRQFAGRAIVDVKLRGTANMPVLESPYDSLNSLLNVVAQLAQRSLYSGEELALVQLIVNMYKDGESEVKPHAHRCQQICVSLGAPREVNVEGSVLQMRNGDCLPLAGELHSVPRAKGVSAARISVCLFYGSSEEFSSGTLRVNATDGKFGDSHWWVHPKDKACPGPIDCAVNRTLSGCSTSKSTSNTTAPSDAYYRNQGGADIPWPEAADAWTSGAAAWRQHEPVDKKRVGNATPTNLRTKAQACHRKLWKPKQGFKAALSHGSNDASGGDRVANDCGACSASNSGSHHLQILK